jgi:hypothetical protein
VAALGDRRPVFALVPTYTASLASALEEAGFEHGGEYLSLVKRLALPVKEASRLRVVAVRQPLPTASLLSTVIA